MRPKPTAVVALSLSDTLAQTNSFNEVEESRRNSLNKKKRSWRFVRPKPPADVAISMSESGTLTLTKSFNEVEESRRTKQAVCEAKATS